MFPPAGRAGSTRFSARPLTIEPNCPSTATVQRNRALPSLFIPVTPQTDCALVAAVGSVTGTYGAVSVEGNTPRFAMPAFVFATQASHHSNRPVETVSPLLAAFNLPLDNSHSDDDYGKVAQDILTHSKYAGAVVLVCWHHGKIQALAEALRVS